MSDVLTFYELNHLSTNSATVTAVF